MAFNLDSNNPDSKKLTKKKQTTQKKLQENQFLGNNDVNKAIFATKKKLSQLRATSSNIYKWTNVFRTDFHFEVLTLK